MLSNRKLLDAALSELASEDTLWDASVRVPAVDGNVVDGNVMDGTAVDGTGVAGTGTDGSGVCEPVLCPKEGIQINTNRNSPSSNAIVASGSATNTVLPIATPTILPITNRPTIGQ